MFNEKEIFKEYPEILTAKMIAEVLGSGYSKALHTIRYGKMHYIKIDNTYRVPKQSFIHGFLKKNKEKLKLLKSYPFGI